jgi:hypothetical protein
MRTKLSKDMSMTEDAAIRIDRTTLQSVYTCTQPGMEPGRWPTDRAYPTVRTLGSYGPILHPSLKTTPLQWGLHRNCEMPSCSHTGVALRGWSHLHLSPLIPHYLAGRYGSALAELNSALTPRSAGWCVRKGPVKRSAHSVSDRGELISSKRK